ncbi:MAG: hypothetical protein R3F55_15505 [Alphaproteobacteria bacterium]
MSRPPETSRTAVLADLSRRAGRLSDTTVIEITGLLDRGGVDPAAVGGREILRARIRVLKPARFLTHCRLFCVPFEMLLSEASASADPLRPVDRSAILPMWEAVEPALPPAVLEATAATLADARSIRDEGLRAVAPDLWAAGAQVVDEAFDRIAARIDDPGWLVAIRAALAAHREILALRMVLAYGGRPAPDDALAGEIVRAVRAAAAQGPDEGYVAAVTAALHFAAPAVVLEALANGGFADGAARAGERVVLERFAAAVCADTERELALLARFDPATAAADAAEAVESVAAAVHGLRAVSPRLRDAGLRKRLAAIEPRFRATLADAVLPVTADRVLRRIDDAVGQMLDGSDMADAVAIEADMIALRRMRAGAEAVALGAEVDGRIAALLAQMERRAAQVVDGEGAGARRRRVLVLVRYVEQLAGPATAVRCMQRWLPAA